MRNFIKVLFLIGGLLEASNALANIEFNLTVYNNSSKDYRLEQGRSQCAGVKGSGTINIKINKRGVTNIPFVIVQGGWCALESTFADLKLSDYNAPADKITKIRFARSWRIQTGSVENELVIESDPNQVFSTISYNKISIKGQ